MKACNVVPHEKSALHSEVVGTLAMTVCACVRRVVNSYPILFFSVVRILQLHREYVCALTRFKQFFVQGCQYIHGLLLLLHLHLSRSWRAFEREMRSGKNEALLASLRQVSEATDII